MRKDYRTCVGVWGSRGKRRHVSVLSYRNGQSPAREAKTIRRWKQMANDNDTIKADRTSERRINKDSKKATQAYRNKQQFKTMIFSTTFIHLVHVNCFSWARLPLGQLDFLYARQARRYFNTQPVRRCQRLLFPSCTWHNGKFAFCNAAILCDRPCKKGLTALISTSSRCVFFCTAHLGNITLNCSCSVISQT